MTTMEERGSGGRRPWAWALLLLLLAGGWFAWGTLGLQPSAEEPAQGRDGGAATRQAQERFTVEVMRVRLQAFTPLLRLSGRAEAAQETTVRSRGAGEVIATPAREGAPVRKGDVLCRLDETTERADLAAAQASLASAERDARAARQLFARGNLPDAQLKQAEAHLQQARAAVRRAELALRWRTIRAPFDAVLHRQMAKVGDLLDVGAPCAVLARLDPLKVVAFASETEVTQLRAGMGARAWFLSGEVLEGRLAYIAPVAEVATRTFRIEVEMANPSLAVRAGMTARLQVPLPAQRVARLPLSALVLADDGRLGVHVVEDGGHVAFVPLRIVEETRDEVLAAGLADGAQVIVTGQYYVKPGARVRAVPRGKLAQAQPVGRQETAR